LVFFTDDQQTFERLIGLPDGIILVTGPTGQVKQPRFYARSKTISPSGSQDFTVEILWNTFSRYQPGACKRKRWGLILPRRCVPFCAKAPTSLWWVKYSRLGNRFPCDQCVADGSTSVFSTCTPTTRLVAVLGLIDIGVKPFLVAFLHTCLDCATGLVRQNLQKMRRSCLAQRKRKWRSLNIDANNISGANFMRGKGCR